MLVLVLAATLQAAEGSVPDPRAAAIQAQVLSGDYAGASRALRLLARAPQTPALESDAAFVSALLAVWTAGNDAAIAEAARARALARRAGDLRRAARAGGLLAFLKRERADPELEALETALAAQADADASGERWGRVLALTAEAGALFGLGDYSRSFARHQQALDLARELQDPALLVPVLARFADQLGLLGDMRTALAHADEAEALSREAGYASLRPYAASYLTWILADSGEPERAVELMSPIVAAWRQRQDGGAVAAVILAHYTGDLAYALQVGGHHEEAETLLRAAWATPGLPHRRRARLGLALAEEAARRGDMAAALDRCHAAVADAGDDLGTRVEILGACGRIAAAGGAAEVALAWLRDGWTGATSLEARAPSSQSRGQLAWLLRAVADPLAGLLLAGSPSEDARHEAFAVIEGARSRALLDQLGDRSFRIDAWPEAPRRRASDALRRRSDAERLLRDASLSEARRREALLELHHARADLDAAAFQAGAARQAAAAPREAAPSSLAAALPDDTALVAFALPRRRGSTARAQAFVLRRGAPLIAVDLGPGAELRAAADAVVPGEPSAEQAGRLLLGPLARHLAPWPARLVVVPGPELDGLAFDALLLQGRPLLDRSALSLAPSGGVLLELAARLPRPVRQDFLAFADPDAAGPAARLRSMPDEERFEAGPLPAARREAASAARLFRRQDVLTGSAASEPELRRRVEAGTRILHLATHGRIRPAAPERSALLLAPGPEDDGLLQPDEIRQLRLNADLVVLSGCDTARETASDRGAFGLGPAFLAAGARSFVGTLWQVSDTAAADLMTDFYAGLARGEPLDRALREAKRRLRDSGRHPTDWAAFVLVAPPGLRLELAPSAYERARGALAYAVAAAVAGLALMAWRRRRAKRSGS